MMPSLEPVQPRHFREVLGHFPTGVCVVTAIGTDGAPVGMAVGSFTSVSLDPPLVAFLPDKSSTTFPKIREAASFCVNVLSAQQEPVCRTFASRGADKFAQTPWHAAPSGAPILDGVVAWIDCVPETIHEAGDHYIFIGRVTSLEAENPTLPLLFFQGGYGAFALKSLVMGAQTGLSEQIVLADKARGEMERLAVATGIDVQAFAPHEDNFVLVAAATPSGLPTPSRIGIRMPIVPPAGRLFVAWAGQDEIDAWYDRSPVELSDDERAELDRELEAARTHGWIPAIYSDRLDDVWETIGKIAEVGQTPVLTRHLSEAVTQLERHSDPADVTEATAGTVQALLAPIFDSAGRVVLMLTLVGIPRGSDLDSIMSLKDQLLAATQKVTASLGR